MNFLKKNIFNIVIILAISVLFSWSFYLLKNQLSERAGLETLDLHIKYYRYVSKIIHSLQSERKASVLYSLKLSELSKDDLELLYTKTDQNINDRDRFVEKHHLMPSNTSYINQLKILRKNMDTIDNFKICESYSKLLELYLKELTTVYKLPFPSEIKAEIMKYMILASMHEAMTQVDQAVSAAIENKHFLNRKHYRFFNNALKKVSYRKKDFLLIANEKQLNMFNQKQNSQSHKFLEKIYTKLLKLTPIDSIAIDIESWKDDFKIINNIQEDIEKEILDNLVVIAQKHIDLVNSTMYLYVILNSIVFFIILGSFLLTRKLYSGLLKQKSELSTLTKAVENSDNNVVITDLNHKIVYVNEAFERITGYSRDEVLGKTPKILRSDVHNQAYYDAINDVISSGKRWLGEFTNRKKDGTLFYEKASITPLINDEEKIEGFIALKLDITSERLSKKLIESKNLEIKYRLYHDTLTNLSNRNQFLSDLKDIVCPTIILININDFKQVNTYYGIQVGDEVLIQLATIFKTIAQEYELKVYRMHSDEFALLGGREISDFKLHDILFFIKTRISEFKFGPKELQLLLYASIGVSVCNKNSIEPSILQLEEADIALKFAKSSNNYYAFYKDAKSLVKTFENNLRWTKKISEAIEEERIIPHFQAIVDKDGKIVFYEALVRIIDKNGDIIYPNTFLEIAKHAKLYPQITRIMIKKVFKIFENREESVSVNISYEDISDERTVRHILSLIDRYNIAKRLTFEILESESILNYDDMSAFIAIVKSKGCRVSIDDFGSGYSNFERILKLDIDYVKIDGSIIKNINSDKNSRVVTETIIHFAKKSGFKLVAEYVCDKAVNDTVIKMGIDYRQGFYIGKPQEL